MWRIVHHIKYLMWSKNYKNYPEDKPLIREQIEPGKGIIGCEMHDMNGWGNTIHMRKPRKKGFVASILTYLFRDKGEEKQQE